MNKPGRVGQDATGPIGPAGQCRTSSKVAVRIVEFKSPGMAHRTIAKFQSSKLTMGPQYRYQRTHAAAKGANSRLFHPAGMARSDIPRQRAKEAPEQFPSPGAASPREVLARGDTN